MMVIEMGYFLKLRGYVSTYKPDWNVNETLYVHAQMPRTISLLFWLIFFPPVSFYFDTFIILFPSHTPDKQSSCDECIWKVNVGRMSL